MYIDLKTPFPPATNSPIGPWRLLNQPGNGSLKLGITKRQKPSVAATLHYLILTSRYKNL